MKYLSEVLLYDIKLLFNFRTIFICGMADNYKKYLAASIREEKPMK